VEVGELLVEIRTGAQETAIKAWLPGTLLHIFVKAGAEVRTGDHLAVLGEAGESIADVLQGLTSQAKPAASRPPAFRTSRRRRRLLVQHRTQRTARGPTRRPPW
jgi:pyruvate/2-oxoglutarate dehydrogenase complex dihydrolipoamide acyltransferase (E2) component